MIMYYCNPFLLVNLTGWICGVLIYSLKIVSQYFKEVCNNDIHDNIYKNTEKCYWWLQLAFTELI